MTVYDRWHLSRPPEGAEHCREHSRGRKRLYANPATHGKGKRWQVRWRDDNDEQQKRNFDVKEGANANECADAFDALITTQMNAGTYLDPDAGKVKFRACAEDYLKSLTCDESTKEAIESRLKLHIYPHLGDVEMRVLSRRPSLIQKWVSGLQLDAGYVRVIVGHVSAVFNAAVDDGMIARNPCKAGSVKLPRKVKHKVVPWPVERVHAVAEALPDRFAAMVTAGAGIGMRQGEIFALSPDDIDFLGREIHVVRQVKIVRGKLVFAEPKGGKRRDVPLAESVGLVLSAHIAEHAPVSVTLPWKTPDGPPRTARLIFTSVNGKALSRNDFNRHIWKPALIAAGVVKAPKKGETLGQHPETGMHALRHFFASSMLSDGVDIRTVSEYLGHSDPGFTLRTYTHLMPTAPDRARKAIDAVFSGNGSALDVPSIADSSS